MTRALLVACAATLLACRGRDRTPVADSPLADSLSAAVGLLRAGMTLGAWIEAHPADSLKPFDLPNLQPNYYSPRPFVFGEWCARAIRHDTITRLAYFYPPVFTPGADLPPSEPDAHQRERRAGCTLGLVVFASPESDSSRGVAAAAALVRPLQQRFGASSIGAGGLSLYWSGSLAWQSGGLGFAVAFSRDSGVVYQAEVEGDPVERVRYGDDQRGLVGIAYRLRPGIGDWEFGNLDADDEETGHAVIARGSWICVRHDTIIAQATRYLEAPHPPVMMARAHLILARGYADQLLGPTPGDAAARAAQHYREVLRLARGTPLEETAWREGWRVSAGLLPVRLRFYCSSGD